MGNETLSDEQIAFWIRYAEIMAKDDPTSRDWPILVRALRELAQRRAQDAQPASLPHTCMGGDPGSSLNGPCYACEDEKAQPASARPDVEWHLNNVWELAYRRAQPARKRDEMIPDADFAMRYVDTYGALSVLREALARMPAPAVSVDLVPLARATHCTILDNFGWCVDQDCAGCQTILAALQRAREAGAKKAASLDNDHTCHDPSAYFGQCEACRRVRERGHER
jgi:hypothetical protein